MSISEKLTTIAQNEKKVYEAGKEYQNDLLWKIITNDGKRTNYNYAFGYSGEWNKNTFKPTYNITPKSANYMFSGTHINGNVYSEKAEKLQIDMEELEQTQGINFDFSQCTSMAQCFSTGFFRVLNVIDLSSLSSSSDYMFYGGYSSFKLKKINKLIFSENTTPNNTWFGYNDITHIGFEGVLAKNGLNVAPCMLDKESITKLIGILSPDTSGLTVTISKRAVNSAFGINIDDEATYPEGSEFYSLRNSKSNWTISYA